MPAPVLFSLLAVSAVRAGRLGQCCCVWPSRQLPRRSYGARAQARRRCRPSLRTPALADPPAIQQQAASGRQPRQSFKDSEALAVYQEILKAVPTHYLALWQAAVLSVKIGARYSDETRKSAYFNAARSYADRALLLRPEGGESNYAVALALFNQATLYKAGARLAAFRDLRSHVYLATEHRPDLAETWQLLRPLAVPGSALQPARTPVQQAGAGRRARRAAAAGKPSTSLEQAHELAPSNLQFCYDLARMCRYQGRRRRAIASTARRRKDSSHYQRRAGGEPAVPQNAATRCFAPMPAGKTPAAHQRQNPQPRYLALPHPACKQAYAPAADTPITLRSLIASSSYYLLFQCTMRFPCSMRLF